MLCLDKGEQRHLIKTVDFNKKKLLKSSKNTQLIALKSKKFGGFFPLKAKDQEILLAS